MTKTELVNKYLEKANSLDPNITIRHFYETPSKLLQFTCDLIDRVEYLEKILKEDKKIIIREERELMEITPIEETKIIEIISLRNLIKKYRRLYKLTQEELAKEIGITTPMISRLENKYRVGPYTIRKLARYFDLTTKEIRAMHDFDFIEKE